MSRGSVSRVAVRDVGSIRSSVRSSVHPANRPPGPAPNAPTRPFTVPSTWTPPGSGSTAQKPIAPLPNVTQMPTGSLVEPGRALRLKNDEAAGGERADHDGRAQLDGRQPGLGSDRLNAAREARMGGAALGFGRPAPGQLAERMDLGQRSPERVGISAQRHRPAIAVGLVGAAPGRVEGKKSQEHERPSPAD